MFRPGVHAFVVLSEPVALTVPLLLMVGLPLLKETVVFFFLPASAGEASRPTQRTAATRPRKSVRAFTPPRLLLSGRRPGLLVAIGDAAAVEVVRRELDLHAVTRQDPDVVA